MFLFLYNWSYDHLSCFWWFLSLCIVKKSKNVESLWNQVPSHCFTRIRSATTALERTTRSIMISRRSRMWLIVLISWFTSYIINLIDSPGHVDFSSDVAAAVCIKIKIMIRLGPIVWCCLCNHWCHWGYL